VVKTDALFDPTALIRVSDARSSASRSFKVIVKDVTRTACSLIFRLLDAALLLCLAINPVDLSHRLQ